MKRPCEYIDRLHLLKDGELSAREKGLMMNHLRTCGECQAEWQAITELSRMIGGIDDVTPGPEFDRAFWAKVDAYENKALINRIKDLFASPRRWVLVPVLATIVLAVAFALNMNPVRPVPTDISLSDQMDLLDDFDVVNNLDLLENWDAINRVELKS